MLRSLAFARTRQRLLLLLLVIALPLPVVIMKTRETLQHRTKLSRQMAAEKAAAPGAIVFLGDSIIEGLDVAAVAPNALNFGIAGEGSRDLLRRLPRYSSLATAHAIFLEIGVNDLLHATGEDIVANYALILAALLPAPKLYLVGILPIDDRAYLAAYGSSASNAEIARLNAAIRALCRERRNCIVLAPFPADGLPAAYHVGDGLHLNQAGYAALAAALRAALEGP